MKISPVAQSSGQIGQSLTSNHVGRTADPMKMDRARAIARGEKVPEQSPEESPLNRPQNDVRKLKMRTNFSTNREMPPLEAAPEAPTPEIATELEPTDAQSSTGGTSEQGEVEATQPLSPQFAALAKQKRALQLERAELDKQKAELAQLQGTKPSADLLNQLKSNPLSVLQEHDALTPEFYNALTDQLMNGQANPEVLELKKKLEALEKGVEEKFQSREAQQEQAALTEMSYEAEALAKEGDDFELIRHEGDKGIEKVLRLIHSTYKTTGRVLDVKDAMNRVENELLAQAEKFAGINKVRNKIVPPSPNPNLQPQSRPQGMRTLTARDTASPQMDRRARAIAAAMGTLKR